MVRRVDARLTVPPGDDGCDTAISLSRSSLRARPSGKPLGLVRGDMDAGSGKVKMLGERGGVRSAGSEGDNVELRDGYDEGEGY